MAAVFQPQALLAKNSLKNFPSACRPSLSRSCSIGGPLSSCVVSCNRGQKNKRSLTVVAAVGDLSDGSTTYLLAGAAIVALIGTAFPLLFSRKDLCPECDGAGFVRQSAATLRANAARKDQAQIVCPRCNGLGKLNQIDK